MNDKQTCVELNTNLELNTEINQDLTAKQLELINCIKVTGAGVNDGIRHGCEDCPTDRV